MYGKLKEYPALSMALESKVIAERESLFMRLKEATTELVSLFSCQLLIIGISVYTCTIAFTIACQSKVVEQIGVLSSNLRVASELAVTRCQDPEQPLFQTLPATMFGKSEIM